MVRAKVLQRSTSTNRSQPRSTDLCRKSSKRQRTATATQQDGPEPQTNRLQQDSAQIFELPPLAQLLAGIDQDQDDEDNLFLPPDPHPALHHTGGPKTIPSTSEITSELPNCENTGSTEHPTVANLPVVSLPDNAMQPAQQFHNDGVSRHSASISLAAQHLRDAQQQSLQQPMFGATAQTGWTVDGQLPPPQDDAAQPTHAADPQDMQPDLLLSDEPFSPHTMHSMFDMPGLSFDSSQHVHEDNAFASTPQSQQHQAADYQVPGFDQRPLHGDFDSRPVDDLQPYHSFPWTSSSMADLQWADMCSAPVNLPNVIRKTSSDSAIDPSTGKLLVYGKAMAHRHVEVELPTVAALFTDINSRVSQKSWQSSFTAHARRGSLAAKAAKRKRITSSMRQTSVTPPPEGPALQGSAGVQQQYHQPHPALHLHQNDQQASLSRVPIQSQSIAATSTPYTILSASAMHPTAAMGTHGQGHSADSVEAYSVGVQPLGTCPPYAGPSTPAESHLYFTEGIQQPSEAHTAQGVAQLQLPAAIAGLTSTGETVHSAAEHVPAAARTGGSNLVSAGIAASTPARKGFGGILSSVVKEAAETATKRPPVFRYEDFKTANAGDNFQGVSRDRWSVQWNASVPKADTEEGEHFLGRFSQQTTAARACDVANLKVHGATAATNFPAREYDDGMEELAPVSVLEVVMALQRQGAIGQFKNSRYQGVWQLDKSCWEARLEDARTQESSTSDRPSADGDQSQSQLTPFKSLGSIFT